MTFAPAHTPRHSTSGGLRRIELLDALRGFALLGASMLALHRIPLFDAKSVLLLVVLFGMGRIGVLRESVAHRRFWRGLLVLSFVATGFLVLRGTGAGTWANHLLRQAASLAQGLFCIAAFVLLFQRTAWRRQLRKLAPMGRMALTHCLSLTLIGLVLVPRLGLDVGSFAGAAILGAGVFALQAMTSCWWMARFRQGPPRNRVMTYTHRRSPMTPRAGPGRKLSYNPSSNPATRTRGVHPWQPTRKSPEMSNTEPATAP